MKNLPLLTKDGYLLIDSKNEPTHNELLDAPQIEAVMRLESTSDTMRGVMNELILSKKFKSRCYLIGRSGHSQIGLDVTFGDEEPTISTERRLIDVPIIITSLNRAIPDILFAVLKSITEKRKLRPTIGRLFIPLSNALSKGEIEEAIIQHHLLLPNSSKIRNNGVIEIPLENIRYIVSTTLFEAGQNAQNLFLFSKGSLGLIQQKSHNGRPDLLMPREFLVGAIKISLGPYLAIIDRELNDKAVFHLAARILDAVRTSGINVPRQIEIYNSRDEEVELSKLRVKIRLFPADPATSKAAKRIFLGGRAQNIIKYGVSFADATNIFNLKKCETLFDNLCFSPTERGYFARILSRSRVVEIPRIIETNEWHERIQNRVI